MRILEGARTHRQAAQACKIIRPGALPPPVPRRWRLCQQPGTALSPHITPEASEALAALWTYHNILYIHIPYHATYAKIAWTNIIHNSNVFVQMVLFKVVSVLVGFPASFFVMRSNEMQTTKQKMDTLLTGTVQSLPLVCHFTTTTTTTSLIVHVVLL